MNLIPSTPKRCRLLLQEWRQTLKLSGREKTQLAGEVISFDRQLRRLIDKHVRVAVFGRVGVGKSSLLNALLEEKVFATDVAHGCTRCLDSKVWNQKIATLNKVELIDTPGIDEIAKEARTRLAAHIALKTDFVLFVLDSDLTSVELQALKVLLDSGKPVLLVLNRSDQWNINEQKALIQSIHQRLPNDAKRLEIHAVAASPRQPKLTSDRRIRSEAVSPQINSLRNSLITLLTNQGELLLALNALRQADHVYQNLKRLRVHSRKTAAQGLIGRFAALKASGIAANPLAIFDLAGGLACDTALVIELCKLYELKMGGPAARDIISIICRNNALLGGTQLAIQLVLSLFRQILILATPITGGLSLGSAAPVAIIQAALAVHTTQITGRLTARELLRNQQQLNEAQPGALLRRLYATDPQVKNWLGNWPRADRNQKQQLQGFLP